MIRTAGLLLLLTQISAAQTCPGPPTDPTQKKGWPKNANVPVNIDPNFTAAERAGIQQAIDGWKNANGTSGNNSQVTFGAPTYNSTPASTGIQFSKQLPSSGNRGQTTTSVNGSLQTTAAEVKIRPDVTNQEAVREVASHEMGHPAGLQDCPNCGLNDSVMAPPPASATTDPNAIGRTPTPTSCDNQAVNQVGGYGTPPPPPDDPCAVYYAQQCRAEIPPCTWDLEQCLCDCGASPLLIGLQSDSFKLSAVSDGVLFDIDGDGVAERVAWPLSGELAAFLALDRNGNGVVDNGTELFGNFTQQPPAEEPNSFRALAVFDDGEHGGNENGAIDSGDAVFADLRLWIDANRNGMSEPEELHPLSTYAIHSISLDYRESSKRDQYGNRFRYRSEVQSAGSPHWAYDVFLVTRRNEHSSVRDSGIRLTWWRSLAP